jgi:hypothetical protein
MVAFSVLGLYFFILAQTRRRQWYLPLSGAIYGLATLCKLFGVLSFGGCLLFLGYQALAGRTSLRHSLKDLVWLTIPFLLISVGGILTFYPPDSAYYGSVIGQHWQAGRDRDLIYRLTNVLNGLFQFFRDNLTFLLALPLLPRLAGSHRPGESILAWQIPTGLAFFILSRPMWSRYWLYLVPIFCLILAFLADRVLQWTETVWKDRKRLTILVGILLIGLGLAQSTPSIVRNARLYEESTRALADYIAEHTDPDDVVLSDYATLNFYARRPSVYQAPIIANAQIQAGFITGADLIAEIEADEVEMVVLHVPGGSNPPSHLIYLYDFDRFYAYLNQHFHQMRTFNRSGQLFEIYQAHPEQSAEISTTRVIEASQRPKAFSGLIRTARAKARQSAGVDAARRTPRTPPSGHRSANCCYDCPTPSLLASEKPSETR